MERDNLETVFARAPLLLMEGALGERLKREYHIPIDGTLAMAPLYRDRTSADALDTLWREYAAVAGAYRLPILLTTPTRRLNRERVGLCGADGDTLAAGNMAHLSMLWPGGREKALTLSYDDAVLQDIRLLKKQRG